MLGKFSIDNKSKFNITTQKNVFLKKENVYLGHLGHLTQTAFS